MRTPILEITGRVGGKAGGVYGFTHTRKNVDQLKVEDELLQVRTCSEHTSVLLLCDLQFRSTTAVSGDAVYGLLLQTRAPSVYNNGVFVSSFLCSPSSHVI